MVGVARSLGTSIHSASLDSFGACSPEFDLRHGPATVIHGASTCCWPDELCLSCSTLSSDRWIS